MSFDFNDFTNHSILNFIEYTSHFHLTSLFRHVNLQSPWLSGNYKIFLRCCKIGHLPLYPHFYLSVSYSLPLNHSFFHWSFCCPSFASICFLSRNLNFWMKCRKGRTFLCESIHLMRFFFELCFEAALSGLSHFHSDWINFDFLISIINWCFL